MSEQDQAKQMIRQAVSAGRDGNVSRARQLLKMAVELDPQQSEGWYWLAYVTKDPSERLNHLQRALKLDPSHERAQKLLRKTQAEAPPPQTEPAAQQVDDLDDDLDDDFEDDLDTDEAPARARANETRDQVMAELSEVDRRGLLRAWLAALRFDAANSYEAYRDQPKPLFTAILMAVVFAVVPILTTILIAIFTVGIPDFGRFLSGIAQTLIGGALFSLQSVLSLYVASLVSSYIGRIQYDSDVTTQQHFTMIGLYFVPAVLLIAAFAIAAAVLGRVLGLILTFEGQIILAGTTFTYTFFVLFVYLAAQFVYSNAAIHRVHTWPALLISGVSALTSSLVFVWLLPITQPLLFSL